MSEDIKVIWEPQPGSQVLFLTCPFFEVLFEGTRGGGKTDCLLMDFAQHVGQGYDGAWRGILFRQSYKQLADIVAKSRKWFPRIFPKAKFNESDYVWKFPSGEELLFRYMNKPSDYDNYHGHEYPWIGWEELTNWPDSTCYENMFSCCRSSYLGTVMPRKIRATTNPFGVGHGWVKQRFIDRAKSCQPIVDDQGRRRLYIHSDLSENKVLLEADPEYIKNLQAITDESKRKAWLFGDWDIAAGSILGGWFRKDVHVLSPFPIPGNWRIDRSFDWGSSRPFSVGWWAESNGEAVETGELEHGENGMLVPKKRIFPKGTKIRIAEWYGCRPGEPNKGLELLAGDIALGIKIREQEMLNRGLIKTHVRPGPADSSIFDKVEGKSIAREMAAVGVRWMKADKSPGSRINGWELLRNLCAAAMDRDEHGNPVLRMKPMENPGLFVFDSCRDWIRTVPMLPRDEKNPDDVDTEAEDHAGDDTRYEIYRRKAESNVDEIEL